MIVKQCKFIDNEGEINGGLYCYEDKDKEYIICMCCGGIVPIEDVDRFYTYDYWENLSNEILEAHAK